MHDVVGGDCVRNTERAVEWEGEVREERGLL